MQTEPYGIGINYAPPSLFIFYESQLGKRRRKIPLRSIDTALRAKDSTPIDLDSYTTFLLSNYTQHLSKISRKQIQNLILKVTTHHKLQTKSAAPPASVAVPIPKELPNLPPKSLDLDKNLNKASDDELERAKKLMEADFQKNRVTKDHPEFQYDIKKDFGAPTMSNEWDSSDDESKRTPSAQVNAAKPKSPRTSILKKDTSSAPAAVEEKKVDNEKSALSSGLIPINQSISKKDKKSLADDLDSLLDSFESDEKEKPKKSTKKVQIISEKSDAEEKKPLQATPKADLKSTTSSTPESKPVDKPADKPASATAAKVDAVVKPLDSTISKPLEPLNKPLLGSLPPLSSLSGLPPLTGLKSLGGKISASTIETEAPRNSFNDGLNRAQPEPKAAVPVLQQSRKSAFHDEIVDDISEDILAADDDEDEEFAHLKLKLEQVSKAIEKEEKLEAEAAAASKSNQTVAEIKKPVDPVPIGKIPSLAPVESNPLNEVKAPTATEVKQAIPAPAGKISSLAPVESKPLTNAPTAVTQTTSIPASGILSSLPTLDSKKTEVAAPKPSTVVAAKPAPVKDQYDYEDDFEAGHTDDEIIFSDDGLSMGSVDKDDLF